MLKLFLALVLVLPAWGQDLATSVYLLVAAPVMHVDQFLLSTLPAVPALSAPPLSTLGGLIIFSSSQYGNSFTHPVTNIQQSLSFILPTNQLITAADTVYIVYWAAH
jgi:hypothetical protein